MKTVISYTITVVCSTLLSFLVFAAIFSDGSTAERLWTLAVLLLGYFVVSLLLGWLNPSVWWRWMLGLDFPAAVILGWYAKNEAGSALLCGITGLMIVMISFGGSRLGSHGNKKQDVL